MIRNHPFFKSIQAKASALFFVVFISIILPVNYIIYSKVRSTLIEADTKELKAEASKLLSQVKIDPPVIPLPPIGYSLRIQNSDALYSEDIFTSPDFPELAREDFLFDSFEYDTFKIVNLNAGGNPTSGVILSLARSNNRLTSQLNNLKVYLFAASAGSILIAGLLVFVAAGFVLRPIKKIITVAQRISASNSIERVPVPDVTDESHQLAKTLNAMLSRIEVSIKNQVNFFASAAHELKTPLAVMRAELTLMRDGNKDSAINRLIQSQLNEVLRLDRVIHDFLLISQLKSDSLTIRKKGERLDEVIYAALKKMKYVSRERSSQILVHIEDSIEDPIVFFDFDKMETVFANLIENSIRHSPEKSIIRIVVKSESKVFSVSCINPIENRLGNLHTLTSEFKKSEHLSSGLGMGLWICDQIIKLHGAELILKEEGYFFCASVKFLK